MRKELNVEIDREKFYGLEEALNIIKQTQRAKFIESVDLSLKLGIDPKKPEQQIRNSFSLPNGSGKKRIIVAIVNEKEKSEAEKAGADFVGGEDIIDKISDGWLEFDVIVTTPEMMPKMARVGKLLGTKGLMPNVKVGTVTKEIGKTVEEFKKGKISFKSDKFGGLNILVGKSNFSLEELKQNVKAFMKYLISLKPPTSRGQFIRRVHLSLTMGPSVKLDPLVLQRESSTM